MKPVDTNLSELEHRIEQLHTIALRASKTVLHYERTGSVAGINYWKGYQDCAEDFAETLEMAIQWRKDHSV